MVLEIIAIVLSSLSVLFSLLTFFLHDRKLVKIEEARRKNEIEERERNSYLNRPQLKVVYSSFNIKTFGYKYEDDFDIDIFFYHINLLTLTNQSLLLFIQTKRSLKAIL